MTITRYCWLLSLLPVMAGCTARPVSGVAPTAPDFPRFVAAIATRDSAGKLFASDRFAEAAETWLRAAERAPDLVAPGLSYFDAARSFARAKAPDDALAALDAAVSSGFHEVQLLATDPALEPLRGAPRWPGISAGVRDNEQRYRAAHADPARARIITDDIPRFWRAFDLALTRDSAGKAEVFQRDYLAAGSPGLLDFYRMKIVSPARLAATVTRFPRFYESIRRPTLELSGLDPVIRRAFHRMKELYPESIYPDLYFVVGRVSSAGTATDYGLLFGAEQNVGSSTTVLDELSEGHRKIVFPRDDLPHVVAHELVHFQQELASKHTLLDAAMIEGGATFIAGLILPSKTVPHFRTWGESHAGEVWDRFSREMNSDSIGAWIGNNSTATAEWPADLGYFVGYEISRAYYERMADKRQAIRDLIQLEDPQAILRASRYGENLGR